MTYTKYFISILLLLTILYTIKLYDYDYNYNYPNKNEYFQAVEQNPKKGKYIQKNSILYNIMNNGENVNGIWTTENINFL